MAYDRKDYFYRRAKREGKASRAVYKLAELQRRFQLVAKGDTVVDLGCTPGGWMQELAPMVGSKGRVIGIDILPMKIQLPKNCTFIKGDVGDEAKLREIENLAGGRVECVLSDMSPNLSGIDFADAYNSYELAQRVLEVCGRILKTGGNLVVKIFPGEEFASYVAELKSKFKKVSTVIPKASRKTSSERYLVCINFKGKG